MDARPSAAPKHLAIREELRQMVLAVPVDSPLPPERELAERWGVARMTVRQAIQALAGEGLVRTIHGHGTLRAPDPIALRVRLRSFADAVRDHGMTPATRLLECVTDPDPPQRVVAFLGERHLVRIRRLRLGDDLPLALERTWLPEELVPDTSPAALSGSLYAMLRDRGALPDSGDEAVRADLPDVDEARLLGVARTRPVLRLVRCARTAREPVEYAEAVLPADRHELWFPLGEERARALGADADLPPTEAS